MEIIGLTNLIPLSSNSELEINIEEVKDWVHELGFLKEHQDISNLITEEKFKLESDKTFKVIDITNWFQEDIYDVPIQEGAITEELFNTLLEYDGIVIQDVFLIKSNNFDDLLIFHEEDHTKLITVSFDKFSLLYFVNVVLYYTPTIYHHNFYIKKLSSEFFTANGFLNPDLILAMANRELITVEVNNFGIFLFYKMSRSYQYVYFIGLFQSNDWTKFYCLHLNTDTYEWGFSPIDIQIDITNQLTQLVTMEQRIATLENTVAQLTSTTTNE